MVGSLPARPGRGSSLPFTGSSSRRRLGGRRIVGGHRYLRPVTVAPDPTALDRSVRFDLVFNVRDLGGLPTADGRTRPARPALPRRRRAAPRRGRPRSGPRPRAAHGHRPPHRRRDRARRTVPGGALPGRLALAADHRAHVVGGRSHRHDRRSRLPPRPLRRHARRGRRLARSHRRARRQRHRRRCSTAPRARIARG